MFIRAATAADVVGINLIREMVWSHESARTEDVDCVRQAPDHALMVAAADEQILGFVDGFLTLSAQGCRRWEVDLLAVHPSYQRQGIARQLIAASTEAGWQMGASLARALIQSNNIASQRAFATCGFQTDVCRYDLYTATGAARTGGSYVPPGLHLLPVNTINYRGLWLEGQLTQPGFDLARSICQKYGYDVAGAVILRDNELAIRAAATAGFHFVDQYQWWQLKSDAAPAHC